jgi:hypothetical protein
MLNHLTVGGKRDEWEFEYTAGKLAEGAKAQREYRQSRVLVWEGKKDEVMAKVRDSGISVTESVADKMASYSNTVGNYAPTISVDPALQKQLQECHSKIQTHRTAVVEYDGWVQIFEANPESRLKLTQADWLYFFGKA